MLMLIINIFTAPIIKTTITVTAATAPAIRALVLTQKHRMNPDKVKRGSKAHQTEESMGSVCITNPFHQVAKPSSAVKTIQPSLT